MGKSEKKLKHKSNDVELVKEHESIDELVEELENVVEEEVKKIKPVTTNDDGKRDELIKASEESFISQKVEYLKKCSNKIIDKIHKTYMIKRKKEADIFLTELFISQFSSALGGMDAIEDPKNLTDELNKNPILKKDIENIVSLVSPYIPLIGLFGGIAITGKHIYQHKFNNTQLPPAEKNANSTA